MKNLIFASIIVCLTFASCTSKKTVYSGQPVTHESWDSLLQQYVSPEGKVDYAGFQADSLKLNQYLSILENNHPGEFWSENEKKAFWINAYNAFTVKLIVQNYPTESIKDLGGSIYRVNTPWDIEFIKIGKEVYDLNDLEHNILRVEFDDPRIHFAINCASVSCPKLLNESYESNKLDEQLDNSARYFIRNQTKNKLSPEKSEVSKIFKWFSSDFTKNMTLVEFINQFSEKKLNSNTEIDYLDYDWNLND